jgi:hypothetical protein
MSFIKIIMEKKMLAVMAFKLLKWNQQTARIVEQVLCIISKFEKNLNWINNTNMWW